MKEAYRSLCADESSIPLFSQAWWLDAVAGDAWDIALVYKGEEIAASMPYLVKKLYGMRVISQPPLTQALGPWVRQTNAKYVKRLSREKDLMQALIKQLPSYDHFVQSWDHTQTNWLPFYWKGFSQTTRYSYRIEELDLEKVWFGFQENIRREIRKASNKAKLRVRENLPLEDFWAMYTMVFERQGKKVPLSKQFIQCFDQAAVQKSRRKIFIAEDEQGRHHAGVYLVWDENSAYYLMGGGDPHLRSSGATSLCMWEAIKFASTVSRAFDFEGSMLEPVERFFRSFGAVQTPYHRVSHTPSRVIKVANSIKHLVG